MISRDSPSRIFDSSCMGLAYEGMQPCVAGSLGRPDMYADTLSQKDRSAMALNLQAQTLADAAKVTPHPALFPLLPCLAQLCVVIVAVLMLLLFFCPKH